MLRGREPSNEHANVQGGNLISIAAATPQEPAVPLRPERAARAHHRLSFSGFSAQILPSSWGYCFSVDVLIDQAGGNDLQQPAPGR